MSYAQKAPLPLALAEQSRALDGEAAALWGLNPFALVEAAGRACAGVLARAFPRFFDGAGGNAAAITVLAGSGNNAADALVLLRALILEGRVDPAAASVLLTRFPADGEPGPLAEALRSIQKLRVPVRAFDAAKDGELLARTDMVIDGIAGTGLRGPLHGIALAMTEALNSLRESGAVPLVAAVDVPSGSFDRWRPPMPVLRADATLAIEPRKICLYTPALRPSAGRILSVGGIFPRPLMEQYREAELLSWRSAAGRVPPVKRDSHKYERGLVEIRAGSPGAAGAAKLAARGAQAAGAGLVRLIVDDSLYPLLAPDAGGVMVVPGGLTAPAGRFEPDAVLLGPGWGRGADRSRLLETYLSLEERGVPLILDADAVYLAREQVFHGNAVLTPHTGEFAAYSGLPQAEILADPAPVLRRFAREKNVYILFKSHVLYIAAPDGRLGIIDGMNPVLATGGSGDVLAGFCAALAARQGSAAFDGYVCACAAAALLVEAARKPAIAGRFIDPGELAEEAASIAGKAWLRPDREGDADE